MAGIFSNTASGGMVAAGRASRTITAGTTRSDWQAAYTKTVIWLRVNGKFTRHDPIGVATDDWNDVYYHCPRRDIFYGEDTFTPEEYAAQIGLINDLENRSRYNQMLNDLR
jgi:hypothetical protein